MKSIYTICLLPCLLWSVAAWAQVAATVAEASPPSELPPSSTAVLDRSELLAGSSGEVRRSLQPALEQFPEDPTLAEIAAYQAAHRSLLQGEPPPHRLDEPAPCPKKDSDTSR